MPKKTIKNPKPSVGQAKNPNPASPKSSSKVASQDRKRKLVLLDSHAIIHRAYHALPDFASRSGEPTGALYGLSTMLMGIIKDFKPYHIIAAFDLPKPTYRHEAYPDYKSGRGKTDDALIKQLQRARDVFKAFNIPIYEKEGYEADDVIGTITEKLKDNKDIDIIIASGDMDTMQLIDKKKVQVYTLKKGIKDTIVYDEKAVIERFGFKPKLLIDYKGLRGDPSDNIIGIPGIGEKTGTILIQNFGTIEEIYKKLEKKDGKGEEEFLKKGIKPRIINLLKENKEEAEFSKMLATIQLDIPMKLDIPEESWFKTVSSKKIKDLFLELEFRSLHERMTGILGIDSDETKKSDPASPDNVLPDVASQDLQEIAVALWLIDSSITNPTLQDILHFAKTDDFKKAKDIILKEIKKQKLDTVYDQIEKPLVKVVKEMEENGVLVDKKILAMLSKEYHSLLKGLEKDIYKLSGSVKTKEDEFNINSPKQMAEVLFEKMELTYKGMRKTSSGSYSTKEEVLQKLVEVHPIAEKVLDYRELQKLVSTYIDKIPTHLDKDSRLRAKFLQAGTTTGRMASADPNLQNIPVKSNYGRRIRNAFISPKGTRLVAFDYSQIELRLAAILSKDEKLLEIFKEGKDVHTNVAVAVFGVSEDRVDKEMRRKAKVINFGILYGMGVSALQKNLKTDRKEAQKFYDDYFSTFTTLASYLNEVKAETARKGYTTTMFGRKRHFEGIKSSLPFIRAQAERMAINAPIQGSQADLTKLAMVKISEYLDKNNLKKDVKLLLQIHDEVIYEIKEGIIEKVIPEINKIMENILTQKETLGIPIIANASVGKSWGEMKGF